MKDLQLTALMPADMARAQHDLISWSEGKISELIADRDELMESVTYAEARGWKTSTMDRQLSKVKKRIVFHEKIKAALEAGYVIVPNFPVDLFAIRTKGDVKSEFTWSYWGNKEQKAKELPIGEGEYRNPFPFVERSEEVREEGKVVQRAYSQAYEWQQELEFPVTMIKPEIIQATNRAMALDIFDQFGVCPPSTRNDDPVIVGQIINKRGPYSIKRVSFLIAWHLNTKDL